MRSALVTLSLAVLVLLLSLAALLSIHMQRMSGASQLRLASELSITLEQLRGVVGSEENWSQSDELAQLIAVADVQARKLQETPGAASFLASESLDASTAQVDADWLILREALLSEPVVPLQPPQIATQPATQQSTEPPNQTQKTEVVVTGDYAVLAEDFKLIRTRVFEGTQSNQLRSLVERVVNNWGRMAQLSGGNAISAEEIISVIEQQKSDANDLVRLSGVQTDSPLFGYSTKELILSYVNRLDQIEVNTVVTETPVIETPVTTEQPVKAPPVVVEKRPFDTQPFGQLKQTLQQFNQQAALLAQRFSRAIWLSIGGFFVSLLMSVLAAWKMLQAARNQNLSEAQVQAPAVQDHHQHDAFIPVEEADTLLEDLESVSDGDLRYPVRVPEYGPPRAIAESVNRTGGVMHNLVAMTRGVAERLTELVAQHNNLGEQLSSRDIHRQSQTAELSDSVSVRLKLLSEQQALLKDVSDVAKEVGKKTESASGTVNGITSALATVSAQVEVGNERMQRLLQTADAVGVATRKIKQLAESTRLQTLNVSLQMTEGAYPSEDAQERLSSTANLDDIHQLTARLVQTASEADIVVAAMRNDIAETTQALALGRTELNESASLTYVATLGGKELAGFGDAIDSKIATALENIEQQKKELAQSAECIVSLDKTGNNYSHLTMTLTQDIAELESMATKLAESVAGFKLRDKPRHKAGASDPEKSDDHNIRLHEFGDKPSEDHQAPDRKTTDVTEKPA